MTSILKFQFSMYLSKWKKNQLLLRFPLNRHCGKNGYAQISNTTKSLKFSNTIGQSCKNGVIKEISFELLMYISPNICKRIGNW